MIYDIDAVNMVIEHYVTLSHGNWPQMKNYESAGVRLPGVLYHAPYEDPCMAAADIAGRVRICGRDGLIVQLYSGMLTGDPVPVEEMILSYRLASNTVDIYQIINKVAWYCTDEEQKKELDYAVWKRLTKHERRMRYDNSVAKTS